MTGTKLVALTITLLLLGTNAFGEETSPNEILSKVEDAYRALKTYKAEGTIVSDIDTGQMKIKTETSFSILLKKPNLYLISWTQKNMPMPGMVQSGAVWSEGIQPYLYMSVMNAYSKISSDETALASATGISGGAAFTIPSLFLPVFKDPPAPFSRLRNPRIERTDKIAEEDCYVISGPSTISKEETFWVSKTTHLLQKYCRSFEPPEGGRPMPEMTDEQLEETLKGMGKEVTEENKKSMREMMKNSQAMLKTTKLKGSSTELHVKISSPELKQSDFKFTLPEDTALKDSLLGEGVGESKGILNESMNRDKQ